MGFIIGTVLALLFLEGPWRGVAIVLLATYELFEIFLWLRWRKRRSITGPDALIGTTGTAITDLGPEGQIRVRGQIWNARCGEGASAGDEVVVEAVDGLRLEVRPGSLRAGAPSSSGRAPDF